MKYLLFAIVLVQCTTTPDLGIKMAKTEIILEWIPKDNEIYDITDISVDEDGMIYLVESNNHKILKFNREGNLINQFGEKGEGPCEFSKPLYLDIWKNWMVISDYDATKLFLLQTDFSSCNEILLRNGLPLDATIGTENDIYVLVYSGRSSHVEKYSPDGKLKGRFPLNSVHSIPLFNTGLIETDKDGRVMVAYRFQNLIELYSSNGEYLGNATLPEMHAESELDDFGAPETILISNISYDIKHHWLYILVAENDIYPNRYIHIFDNDIEYLSTILLNQQSKTLSTDLSGAVYATQNYSTEIIGLIIADTLSINPSP